MCCFSHHGLHMYNIIVSLLNIILWIRSLSWKSQKFLSRNFPAYRRVIRSPIYTFEPPKRGPHKTYSLPLKCSTVNHLHPCFRLKAMILMRLLQLANWKNCESKEGARHVAVGVYCTLWFTGNNQTMCHWASPLSHHRDQTGLLSTIGHSRQPLVPSPSKSCTCVIVGDSTETAQPMSLGLFH